jgi:hypothetical protein
MRRNFPPIFNSATGPALMYFYPRFYQYVTPTGLPSKLFSDWLRPVASSQAPRNDTANKSHFAQLVRRQVGGMVIASRAKQSDKDITDAAEVSRCPERARKPCKGLNINNPR